MKTVDFYDFEKNLNYAVKKFFKFKIEKNSIFIFNGQLKINNSLLKGHLLK